jgi:hypothetical protein
MTLMKAALVFLIILLASAPLHSSALSFSRVYVSLYPCSGDARAELAVNSGQPVVTLYDRQYYGDDQLHGFNPSITVTKGDGSDSTFYFDVQPGNYEAFVKLSQSPRLFIHNGPLIVISGQDRHLFVAGCGLTDWHSVAAVAGVMPMSDVTITVLVSESQMHCGDDIYALDQKTLRPQIRYRRSQALIDSGAYYANFHGYGKQDHTVALEFSGALFTRGAVLITDTPDTTARKPPLIIKDITPSIVQAATRASGKLVCVQGF